MVLGMILTARDVAHFGRYYEINYSKAGILSGALQQSHPHAFKVLSHWLTPCKISAPCNNILSCNYNPRACRRNTKMNMVDYLTFILQSIELTPATE